MNRPSGYYRDERGREYYWDGQRRSYIPRSSYDRMNEDLAPLTNCLIIFVVIGIGGIVLLFVVALILEELFTAFSENPVGNILSLFVVVAFFVGFGFLFRYYDPNRRRDGSAPAVTEMVAEKMRLSPEKRERILMMTSLAAAWLIGSCLLLTISIDGLFPHTWSGALFRLVLLASFGAVGRYVWTKVRQGRL